MSFHLICYLVAFFCFAIAACGGKVGNFNLVATGLAAWVLTLII